ncbi:hypothetical protein L7F22_064690 [Adiantum nelumboides]|nr:hypothetical protein [Adiantum nelumboides]
MVASDIFFEPRPLTKQSDGKPVAEVLQTVSLNEDSRGRGPDVVRPASLTGGKRPKIREVTSRLYKAATISSANAAAITASRYQSPSRGRSPSPNFGRRSLDAVLKTPPPDKRPASADRRRPWPASVCENKTPTSHNVVDSPRCASKRFAVRSLSSSFQSDTSISSFSNDGTTEHQNIKARTPVTLENDKAWNSSTKLSEGKTTPARKRSPLRRSLQVSEQTENSKRLSNGQAAKPDTRRWHGVGNGKPIMSRSMDFGFGKERSLSRATTSLLGRSASRADRSASNSRPLSRSANEGPNPKLVRCIYVDSGDERVSKTDYADENNNTEDIEGALMCVNSLDDNGSDTESSSSGSLSVVSFRTNVRPRATAVPARFWQDATSMTSMRRLKVPGSTRSLTPVRATDSGHSTPQYPSSPSSQVRPMQTLSTSRGWASPTKTRAGHPMLMTQLSLNGRHSSIPGLLSLNFETRKNKQATCQQEEAHDLRLLHNRWLQWRFVNAQAQLATNMQAATAECLLHNCFLRTSDLRMSVASKQGERNKFKQADKLDSVLSTNAEKIKEWETLLPGHASTLTGLMNALEATAVRVPLIGGPKIDIQATKEILSSAIDIMNGIDTSIIKYLRTAEIADSLLSELAKTIVLEKACLIECGDLLIAAASREMEERSLRASFMQQEQEKRPALEKSETTCVVG